MSDKCFCEQPGYSFLGCLQNPTDGELDESVSLFMTGNEDRACLEVATVTAGFTVKINYCPFCGRSLGRKIGIKQRK